MRPETLRWIIGGLCGVLFYLFVQVGMVKEAQATTTVTDSFQEQMLKEIRADIKEILKRLPDE